MKQKQIWMALVNEVDEVVFCRACRSERQAQKTIVDYLRQHREFDGHAFDHAVFWIGDKDLRLDLMVFPMQPEDFKAVWDQLATFRTDLPLGDKGVYRVIYEIDVGAASAVKAAKTVHEIMRDSDSLPPVLDIIDHKGNKIRIDLSQSKPKASGKEMQSKSTATKITDEMIAKARRLWPNSIDFDFVECTNPECTFIGLVLLGDECCPDCHLDSLQWADENQKEFNL
jgi:hypothetical protein